LLCADLTTRNQWVFDARILEREVSLDERAGVLRIGGDRSPHQVEPLGGG